MPPKDKYTDPDLRDQVKEELKASAKGGEPGQWSARKAQMMASEYKKRGGGYTTDKTDKDESQQHLTEWGEEEWQTKARSRLCDDGEGKAKQDDGTEKRYLPKKAWEEMSPDEKEETDQKKQKESKQGKQHVENTTKAKASRKKAQSNGSRSKAQDNQEVEETSEQHDDDKQPPEQATKSAKAGQKRKHSEPNDSSQKQKAKKGNGTVGSKHMDAAAPAPQGSRDRLPKEGQQVQWLSMPGYVDGKVKEILRKSKRIDGGKQVKASADDPKIVLISNKSGKTCIHKPEACYYDDA
ncbi:hypothetical protein CERZMDRAFT_47250 [Cercospora zeae-maydis SCOH1-5]|uniref:Hypervirulence associated protein TUDOR domain-containing protein n=1 Tax=Cercospora zeae-maydis SCOH1-5 TaxID=717836 RepID=A0A6A6F633_9PEZI|nr:hypothetical protein CERZMDRAFT_47250 [Cercospora zeae-maydis SCOH1-5]